MTTKKNLSVCLLDYNKGQYPGLPKNPRFFRDFRYEAMIRSIRESPEMLELRELIVYPYPEGRYMVVCGNLRLRACKEIGYKELPCKIDEFKERFDAITDDTAVYPLVPKYDEKHELFIIQSGNEVDSNWLRERLGMQRMRSYKTSKIGKSNVIDIRDVRVALEGGGNEQS